MIIIVALVYGCCKDAKDEYHYVPEERKSALQEGDILVYENNFGTIDSIMVKDIEIEFIDQPNDEDCDTWEYYEIQWITLISSKFIEQYPYLYIVQDSGGDNMLFWLNGYLYHLNNDDAYDYESYAIKNVEYNDVYERTEADAISSDYHMDDELKVERILFNCSIGVLSYELDNGEIWELISIITQ